MLGKLFICLSISLYHLLESPFKTADYFFSFTFLLKFPYDQKKVSIILDVLGGNWIKITFPERKMENGIQNVGFTHTIISYQTIDYCIEIKGNRIKVFIID